MSFQTVFVVSLLVAFGVIMLHDIFFRLAGAKRARKAFVTVLEKFLRERTEFSKDDFVEVANVPYIEIPCIAGYSLIVSKRTACWSSTIIPRQSQRAGS